MANLHYCLAIVSDEERINKIFRKLEQLGIPDPGLEVLAGVMDYHGQYKLLCNLEFHNQCFAAGLLALMDILYDRAVDAWDEV
jgi:hypothetical protein